MTEHSEDVPHMHTLSTHVSVFPKQLGDNPHIQVELVQVSPVEHAGFPPHIHLPLVQVSVALVAEAQSDKSDHTYDVRRAVSLV